MSSSPLEHLQRLVGAALALGALLLFTSTLSMDPFPGPSAHVLVQYGGLDPAPPLLYPVWSLAATFLADLPGWSLAFRIGLLSAVSGALCVFLLYRIAAGIPFRIVSKGEVPYLPVVCGAAAAAYLMVAEPFWGSAHRAHPILFHVSLLLLTLRGLQEYRRSQREIHLWGAWFLWGLGMLEWVGMAAALPFLVYVSLHLLRGSRSGHGSILARLTVAWCAGLLCFAAAFLIRLHDVESAAADSIGFASALFELLATHLEVFLQQVSVLGLASVLVCFVLPSLLALHSVTQAPEAESFQSDAVLHGALILVALILLGWGTVPLVEADTMHGFLGVPPVLFTAISFGCAVGYGYVYAERTLLNRAARSYVPNFGFGAFLLFTLAFGAVLNHPRAEIQSARFATRWVFGALETVPDRAILVSDGALHDQLALAAFEQERRLLTIDLARSPDARYRHAIASKFTSEVLSELIGSDLHHVLWAVGAVDEMEERPLAVCAALSDSRHPLPDFIPSIGLLLSSSPAAARDPGAFARAQLAFWNQWLPEIEKQTLIDSPFQTFWHQVKRQSVVTANSLGIWLENRGFEREAFYTYRTIHTFDPGNTSAAVNLVALAEKLPGLHADRDAWDRMLREVARPMSRARSGDMLRRDGPIRFPENWLDLRAAFPGGRAELPMLRPLNAACAQYLGGAIEDADSTTEALVARYPEDPLGWVLRALVAADMGNHEEVDRSVEALTRLDVDLVPLRVAAARAALKIGDVSSARRHLLQTPERTLDNIEALELLVALDVAERGAEHSVEWASRLSALDPQNPWARYASGLSRLAAGETNSAIDEMVYCIEADGFAAAIPTLIRIYQMHQKDEAALRVALHGFRIDSFAPEYWAMLADVLADSPHTGHADFARRRSRHLQTQQQQGRTQDLIVAGLLRIDSDRHVLSAEPEPEPTSPRPAEPQVATPLTSVSEAVRAEEPFGGTPSISPRGAPTEAPVPNPDWSLSHGESANDIRRVPPSERGAPGAPTETPSVGENDGAPPPLKWKPSKIRNLETVAFFSE